MGGEELYLDSLQAVVAEQQSRHVAVLLQVVEGNELYRIAAMLLVFCF